MKALRVVLDVQHSGKPHKPEDRGARCNGLVEAELCLDYAIIAHRSLREMGHESFMTTNGSYGQRAAFSNDINADLYLACHLNSSETPPINPYALVEISEFSGKVTREFAGHIADVFAKHLPVTKAHTWEIKKGQRGWSCINRVKAPALLLEPLFINANLHGQTTKLMCLIGKSVASAVNTFNWGGS